ncbi:hypothetical protein I6E68_05920 [Salinibacterium sp. NSLL150]|uniref:hypothetical protein n=1 Tax=unclassified Salinibacterium TaxID=2632331 RepID=UPI0018CF701B|nr:MULTISPECIES: hypothetical protein [unclassified Salinibacterium]MBH0098677.1 hypothetical protein [Salinibacterium sp. NSLL35]MBH0101432.1 hypothetical protein [Salinibacterium sp. NSLL150]MBH0104191.1 hypothetical protein [Salinibacterium sp. NSLL16]MBH0106952.1 hypothetical protein [Salinibacterium sp. NSLL17]
MIILNAENLIENFWVPLATTVPVVALAYVIEARIVASAWTYERRWLAFFQGLLITTGGLLLLTLQVGAFWSILVGGGNAYIAALAALTLLVVMGALVGYPMLLIVSAAANYPASMGAWLSRLPFAWAEKRRLEKSIERLVGIRQSVESEIESLEDIIADETRQLKIWEPLARTNKCISAARREAYIREVAKHVDKRTTVQTRQKAADVYRLDLEAQITALEEALAKQSDGSSRESASRAARGPLEAAVEFVSKHR